MLVGPINDINDREGPDRHYIMLVGPINDINDREGPDRHYVMLVGPINDINDREAQDRHHCMLVGPTNDINDRVGPDRHLVKLLPRTVETIRRAKFRTRCLPLSNLALDVSYFVWQLIFSPSRNRARFTNPPTRQIFLRNPRKSIFSVVAYEVSFQQLLKGN